MNRGAPQFPLRFPDDGMRNEIKAAAKAARRTMNAEIIARLSEPSVTLRDFFAAQALAQIIAADGAQYFEKHDRHAQWAYAHADAMLKARAINLGEAVKAELAA